MQPPRSLLAVVLLALPCSLAQAGDRAEQAACNGNAAGASAGGWSIRAGPVEWAQGEPLQVSGRFEVCGPDSGAEAGAEPRSGGACLLADLVDQGIGRVACTTHADCNGPDAIDREDPRMAGYVGYCATEDGSGEAPRCWTRPGPPETHCQRSVDGFLLTPGVHRLTPVDGDPLRNGAPYPRWVVYACLAHVGHGRACAEPENPNKQVSLTPVR